MIDRDWEDLFLPWILERGREYWKSGNVTDWKRTGGSIIATVIGVEEYEVDIQLDEGEVTEMYCSCPYAEDGSACKHMASVLFTAEAAESQFLKEYADDPKFPWEDILKELSLEEAKRFLAEIVSESKGLQERLTLRYGCQDIALLQNTWEETIYQIVRRNTDRRGYIDYNHAGDFYGELEIFLAERLPDLLASRRVTEAFELVCMVYEAIMEMNVDDSGESSGIMEACEQAWTDILDLAAKPQKESIRGWFVAHLDVPSWSYGSDQVESFLFSYDWGMLLQYKNLELLDDLLVTESNDSYQMEDLLRWRDAVMRRLGCTEEEIDIFWKGYCELPFVRGRELEQHLAKGNYEDAIKLLREGKERDIENPWAVKAHSEKLLELYRLTNRLEDYREELHFQVFSCFQRDMEYVKQLKEITPDNVWPKLLEQLLTAATTRELHFELLAFDCQWERLFEAIRKKGWLNLLDRYFDLLIQWSPEPVLSCYVDMLKTAMSRASNRKSYCNVIGHLKRLFAYPEGKTAACALAAFWREQYLRRSAMLDEMRKAEL